MTKLLTEAQVLKQLDIPNFKHLSKDNVMRFASMLQKMDPEVAKKALEQFPDFATTVKDALADYKDVVKSTLAEDAASSQQFYDLRKQIQTALEKCLDKDDLSFEEKNTT